MWRSLIDKFKGKGRKQGYTMTELLAVLGIIAVVVAIAIPSIFFISRALKFKQRNDYAKTIFLAAQANLSEMRSDGNLDKLQSDSDAEAVPMGHCGFPAEEWSYEYEYTSSEFPEPGAGIWSSYDLVLPENSVEGTLRSGNVIIEYNPVTGNVFSVFYCDDEILSQYRDAGTLPRNDEEKGDEKKRKEMMLGYYDGSGLSSSKLDLEITKAALEFDPEGEEGILTVRIPVTESYYAHLSEFIQGLHVDLTIQGEDSRKTIGPFVLDMSQAEIDVDGRTVMVDFILDSLVDYGSFANLAANSPAGQAEEGEDSTRKHLSDYIDESEFTLLPGENVSIQAIATFTGEREVDIEDTIASGINPMFRQLVTDTDNYAVYISNGRHLQNLNALAPSISAKITSVLFADDIYWNETVNYYNDKYKGGDVYENNGAENPCRDLPYFVPIHNENLFGTATFEYPSGTNNGGLWQLIGDLMESIFGSSSSITVAFKGNDKVPTLTDALDANTPPGSDLTIAERHAKIYGQDHRVYYLNIDATQYVIPNKNESRPDGKGGTEYLTGRYYATGSHQIVDYYFTGLFGYVNTRVDGVHVVNPIVKGKNFVDEQSKQVPIWGFSNQWNGFLPQYTIVGYETINEKSNPATGALVGASGYNAQITNCSVYIDTKDASFNRSYMGHKDYKADKVQDWYGVSGEGAVGGLIGYAKSHRTTNQNLDSELTHLAFRDCFAAVNVSGSMRGNAQKHYGYSNGVGGLIGNSQLTNFYNCYASGNVKASGLRLEKTTSGSLLDWIAGIFGKKLELPYNGRTSMGVGGFVGTSHGTRYTKCFATGGVEGEGAEYGAGGFVGIMSLDESFSYGNDSESAAEIAQTTILTECYAVGRTLCNDTSVENFSGANARINFNTNQSSSYITSDYYRLYAPVKVEEGREPRFEDTYIFRDSYYLTYEDTEQENSNSCATAELYTTFKDLVKVHKDESSDQDEKWRQDHIDKIKSISLTRIVSLIPLKVYKSYKDAYFDSGKVPDLEKQYHDRYSEGYQKGWSSATEQTTHSYSLNAAGAKYPFTKLTNLDYYGDWPSSPSLVGLAYYETYLDANNKETDRAFYYDRDSTSELSTDANAIVVRDGYAVLSASDGTITVKVGATTDTLKGVKQSNGKYVADDTFYSDSASYHVYLLSDKIMDAAMAECEKGEFYVQLTITDSKNNTYITYFNPTIALTQVNPVRDPSNSNNPANFVATKPETIPSQLYIRSARQFAALSGNEHLWGEEYNYVQQFNIDAATYKWADASDANIGSIGTAKSPFKGTYHGNGGYVEQAAIMGFEPTKGFFGTVSHSGEIRNLDITVGGTTVGTKNDESTGILACVNGGSILNVNLNLTDAVTVAAKTNAGLLVGQNVVTSDDNKVFYTATISNCHVQAPAAAVNALNAGGLIGEAKGKDADNMTSITGCSVNVTNLTSNGGMVGGMVGAADKAKFQNSGVTTVLNADDAFYAGGFAGVCYDSSVMTLVVELSGSCTADGTLAGLVGAAFTTDFTAADVQLAKGSSLTADTVAGAFGMASGINLKNSGIFLPGDLNGTTGAAGFAYDIQKDSVVQLANVTLTNGSVTAANGKAAGYAVVNAGSIANSAVKLGTNDNSAVAISGKEEAVGFAGTVSGDISSCSVAGRGAITASAGPASAFAGAVSGTIGTSYATPATSNTKEEYIDNGNYNLTVSGTSTAGFALSLDNKATISGSYILCQLTNSTGGFAGVNEGSISECTANVTQTGAAAFVGDNSGKVNNCYGWYGDNTTTDASDAFGTNTGRVTSSYFANIDAPEGLAELYDYKGTCTQVAPGMITVDDLNTETYHGWVIEEDDPYWSYPYKANLKPGYYPYPRLNNHYGNWVREVQYAYGVIYYEQYSDDSWSYRVVELSDPNETVDKQSMSTKSVDLRGNDVSIEKVGYALFYHAEKCPFDEAILDKNLFAEENPFAEALGSRYEVAGLIAKEPMEFKSQVKTADGDMMVEVIPFFADAIDAAEYQVRTPEQLSHVDEYSGETFFQTHTIEVNTLEKIDTFSGSYTAKDNSALIVNSAPEGWMGTVTGTVELGRLTVDEFAAPIFGTISKNVKVSELTTKDAASKLVNKITGGTVTLTKVSLGNSTLDTLMGEISGGTVTMGTVTVSGEVTGSLIGKIGGGTTNVNSITVGGAAEGTLVGEISGGITTLTKVTVGGETVGTLFGEISNGTTTMGTVTVSGEVTGSLIGKISGGTTTVDKVTVGGAAEGTLVGSVTGGSTTLTNVTVDGKTVGTLFGAITGGTLKGETITISGAITDNLFASVASQATLSDFTVTANGVDASLIGAVNGTVKNIDLVCKTESYLIGSGILTNAVTGGTIEDCDVTMGIVNADLNSFLALNTEKTQLAFGGIAAQLPGAVTFKNNTVEAVINVTGADDKLAVIGGMVGYSAANITGGSSNVTVNYTQTEKDQVGIGGLAAWSEKGITISGTKDTHIQVAGQINLNGTASSNKRINNAQTEMDMAGIGGEDLAISDAEETPVQVAAEINVNGSGSGRSNYYIGGAIAYDEGATYQYITSSVAVDTDWKGCVSGIAEPADNPSGAGNVGMFVGRVQSGIFKNCASTADNGTYQFLGEIRYTAEDLPSDTTWYSRTSAGQASYKVDGSQYTDASSAAGSVQLNACAAGTQYRTYSATLNNCTFVSNGKIYLQTIDADTYYYTSEHKETDASYTATKQTASSLGDTGNNEWYMIVEKNDKYAFNVTKSSSASGKATTISNGKLTDFDGMKYALWTVKSRKWTNEGGSGKLYLQYSNRTYSYTSTNGTDVTLTKDGNYYKIKAGRFLTYYNGFSSNSSSGSQFYIYKITMVPGENYWSFTCQEPVNYTCTAVPYGN